MTIAALVRAMKAVSFRRQTEIAFVVGRACHAVNKPPGESPEALAEWIATGTCANAILHVMEHSGVPREKIEEILTIALKAHEFMGEQAPVEPQPETKLRIHDN